MMEKEAAFLLGVTRENLVALIEKGVTLPVSKIIAKLPATRIGSEYSIPDEDLNAFIARFEAEEPGRHPPADVRRELLTEANHHCGICRQRATRLQFHHILEWEKIKHHDPKHMIAICGTCHDDCGMGKIDKKSQEIYKARLARSLPTREISPVTTSEHTTSEAAPVAQPTPCRTSAPFGEPASQPATLPQDLRDRFKQLRSSFESLALRSKGLHHVLVERDQSSDDPEEPDGGLPPGLVQVPRFAGDPEVILLYRSPPGDPARFLPVTDEDAASASTPASDGQFIRDASGRAMAKYAPPVIRSGYFYGDHDVLQPYTHIANAAGNALRATPNGLVAKLPDNLRPLCREQRSSVKRYVFGKVPTPMPPPLSRGWVGGMLRFDGGVIVDHPDGPTGGDDPGSAWMLLLHRLGWSAESGSALRASRYHWIANASYGFGLGGQVPGMPDLPKPPLNRFYSILGDGRASATDICWASVWAIDRLMTMLEGVSGDESGLRGQPPHPSIVFRDQLAAMRPQFQEASQKYFRLQHALMADEAWEKEKAAPKLPWCVDSPAEHPNTKSLFVCTPSFANTVPAIREFHRLAESARHYLGGKSDWLSIVYDAAGRNGEVEEFDGGRRLTVDLFTACVHAIDRLLASS